MAIENDALYQGSFIQGHILPPIWCATAGGSVRMNVGKRAIGKNITEKSHSFGQESISQDKGHSFGQERISQEKGYSFRQERIHRKNVTVLNFSFTRKLRIELLAKHVLLFGCRYTNTCL